jgi:hypothetical protein
LRGSSKFPPQWALIFEFAKEFNISPMEVEEKVTQEWWLKWLIYREEVDKANKTKNKR